MANMDMIEQELRQFIDESQHLSRQDKYVHLKAIFDKHFAMEKTAHIMDIGDLRHMIDYAKGQFINTSLPMKISKKEVYPTEVPHVLMIEAVIAYLNKHKILKKLVNFDFNK